MKQNPYQSWARKQDLPSRRALVVAMLISALVAAGLLWAAWWIINTGTLP